MKKSATSIEKVHMSLGNLPTEIQINSFHLPVKAFSKKLVTWLTLAAMAFVTCIPCRFHGQSESMRRQSGLWEGEKTQSHQNRRSSFPLLPGESHPRHRQTRRRPRGGTSRP